ncbi:MAG: Fic family protein [Synergistaceae bacterium]|jgi:fido (protein-threonine AMPylation protein)|nr:Fic family protein [Synergistaceae bacterium]
MASKRSWIAPFVMESGLSCVLGDVCESVGGYVERVGGSADDAGALPCDPYQISDLMKAHEKLLGRSVPEAGVFRTTEARVTRGAQVAFVPPLPSSAKRLTDELFEWLDEPGEHPLIAFSIFHYQLLCIHPFTDGNGRLARLWHSALIGKWRPSLASLNLEEAVTRDKADYLMALERSDRQKNAAPFVLYMLKLIQGEVAAKIAETPSVTVKAAEPPARLSDFLERLLLVFDGRTLTGAEVMSGLHMSHRGTFRKNYLDPAIEADFVEMTQPDSPRSPTQKYRLTQLGKEAAQKIE